MFRAHSLSLAMLSHLNSDLASILKSTCHVLAEKKNLTVGGGSSSLQNESSRIPMRMDRSTTK